MIIYTLFLVLGLTWEAMLWQNKANLASFLILPGMLQAGWKPNCICRPLLSPGSVQHSRGFWGWGNLCGWGRRSVLCYHPQYVLTNHTELFTSAFSVVVTIIYLLCQRMAPGGGSRSERADCILCSSVGLAVWLPFCAEGFGPVVAPHLSLCTKGWRFPKVFALPCF